MASIKLKGDTSGEVTISAPSVAGTTTLELPATSSTLATQNSLGVRNLIINGDMNIAQRGTSATGITSTGYRTVDRFSIDFATAGTWTNTQDTDVPSGQGFSYSNKLDCTTANGSLSAGSVMIFNQRIEGQNLQHLKKGTSNAESVALSFWVKSNKTGTYIAEMFDSDHIRHICKSYTINTADTWEKKTIAFAGDTTGAFDNDNGASLYVNLWLVAGTNFTSGTLATSWASVVDANRAVGQVNLADNTANYINITGLQLEVGTEATPFEHRPYDMELQRCYRYYWQQVAPVSGTRAFATGSYLTSAYVEWAAQFPVTMRATPSVVSPTVVGGYEIYRNSGADAFDVVLLGAATTNSAFLYNNTQVSGTAGQAGSVYSNNSSASLAFSAEL